MSSNEMLTSHLLKAAKKGANIKCEFIDNFLIKMFSLLPLVAIICVFGLISTNGWKTDIVVLVGYIILYFISIYRASLNEAYMQLFLGSGKLYGGEQPFYNTMNEYEYLYLKLKKCEKQKDFQKRREMYNEIIVEMDRKYGKGQHLVGLPYTEKEKAEEQKLEQEKQIKIQKEQDKIDKQAGIDLAWKNIKIIVPEIISAMEKYLHEVKNNGYNYEIWQEMNNALHWKVVIGDETKKNNLVFQSSLNNEMIRILGNLVIPYKGYSIFDKRKNKKFDFTPDYSRFNMTFIPLIYLRCKTMFCEKDDCEQLYYFESEQKALEGKIFFEMIQMINERLKTKVKCEITNEIYKQLCEYLENKRMESKTDEKSYYDLLMHYIKVDFYKMVNI